MFPFTSLCSGYLVAGEDFEVTFRDGGTAGDEVDLVEAGDAADLCDVERGDIVHENVVAVALIVFHENLLAGVGGVGLQAVGDSGAGRVPVGGVGLGEGVERVDADRD